MAELPDVFKASEVSTDPTIPAGWILLEVVKSEYKANSAKTGHYLSAQLKAVEGKHKGRMVFELMNLDNPNQTAVEIANRTLASMCKACGIDNLEDSEDLHNIPMACLLAIDPGNAGWPPKNIVKQYLPEAEMPDLDDNGDPFEAE